MASRARRPPPTEAVHARADEIGARDVGALVRLLLDEEVAAARVARGQARAIAVAAQRFAAVLDGGGRVIYAGAGTSGRLGVLDAAELPPTFGLPAGRVVALLAGGPGAIDRAVEGAEDRPGDARRALRHLDVDERDLVCAIAASGATPFALAALDEARRHGAASLLITCAPPPRAAAARIDQVLLLAVGPEVVAGSTRLKAATATKLALAAISTAAMAHLGKVWRGRMVDVVAANAKLRERALRIVVELGGVDEGRARALLRSADGHVKKALVAALLDVTVDEAAGRLAAAADRIDVALAPVVSRRRRR